MDKKTLISYITKEQWKLFFSIAEDLCTYQSDKDTLISLQMRLNRLEKDRMNGILSFDNYQTELARIRSATIDMTNEFDYTKIVTVANVADVTVNNTTVNNFTVATVAATPASKDFDPFYIDPQVLDQLSRFMAIMRQFIILSAQTNLVLPEIFEECTDAIAAVQEMSMTFITSENAEERDEIFESLSEYKELIAELELRARKELKRAQGNEKNQVAQILKEVKVGNSKNLSLFKAAYAVFEQLGKGDVVSVPKVLPVNATSLGLLVKKWIKLANS